MNYFINSYKKLSGNIHFHISFCNIYVTRFYTNIIGNVSPKSLACITGKSFNHGGLKKYEDAMTDGIMAAADTYLHNEEIMAFIGLSAGWADKTYIIKVNLI